MSTQKLDKQGNLTIVPTIQKGKRKKTPMF